MATYTYTVNDACFTLDEHPIYGSARLGVRTNKVCVDEEPTREEGTEDIVYVERGYRNYEFSNHLGNVLTVTTDRRTTICDGEDEFVNYEADILTVTDYYPFGSPMAGRTHNQEGYRFGFNGQERDDEVSGIGNTNAALFWEYDSRLGRRWNLDPKPNPSISYYAAFANNPIIFSDILGDTIVLDNSFLNSSIAYRMAFYGFMNTKAGYNFLKNYAGKGQTIFGVTFTEAGKYHKAGIDLNFYMGGYSLHALGATDVENLPHYSKATSFGLEQPRLQVRVTFYTTCEEGMNGQNEIILNVLEVISHESFIHVNDITMDALDDKVLNHSNMPKEFVENLIKMGVSERDYGHYYANYLFENNNNNWKDGKSSKSNMFNVISIGNDYLKTNKSDQQLKEMVNHGIPGKSK